VYNAILGAMNTERSAHLSQWSRREFVKTGAAAGVLAAGAKAAAGQGPTVLTPRTVKPVVVGSANGNQYKNGGTQTGVEVAFARLVKGEDVVDAVVAGVNLCELDPLDDSVGYGGLPNADGVVQLDASVMHGTKKRAGAVAGLEGVRTPSLVARAVMLHTDHHLLVGKGAQEFARQMGFTVEDDLNSENSRKKWLDWKRRIDPDHWLDPVKRSEAGARARDAMMAEGLMDPRHVFGTINLNAVTPKGEIGGTTTTSGLAFKIPGRVGDSPVLGAGLYVDGEVGAAGSTGRGEANLYNLCSFLIVENLRRGMTPKDAGVDALKRIRDNTVEKRLLNARGLPNFYVKFYVVNAKGEVAGVAMYGKIDGKQQTYAVCSEKGPETRPIEAIFEEQKAD
jgi:N4-(beta-N-acetylglucosaminyl)-L-asparaginase